MSHDETDSRGKRERSARYPGVPLADGLELCRFIDERGLDGLSSADIATALGYRNIKTNTFSARLSSARQFGLLNLRDEGYTLSPLARSILHPVDRGELPRLHRQALLTPPLYAELAQRLADKRVPEAAILANVLYHSYQITARAKLAAAESFLESARFAVALGDDGIFRAQGNVVSAPAPEPAVTPSPPAPDVRAGVRIDLRLWGPDRGKVIRIRAPDSITSESFDRLVQALRLHLRIDEPEGDDRQLK